MQKIRKAVPHLGLMLYEYQTEALLKRLRDGEIDVGIMALPVLQDGVESRALYEETFTVALPTQPPSGRQDHHQGRRTLRARRCCCWKMAIVCATRRWKFAAASRCARPRTFAPPVWRLCVRWWSPDSASRCCRRWPWNRLSARSAASPSGSSASPHPRAPSAPCGASPAPDEAAIGVVCDVMANHVTAVSDRRRRWAYMPIISHIAQVRPGKIAR